LKTWPTLLRARARSILGMVLFNATHQELASIHAGLYAGLAYGSLA
jgi:hypothetical protein